MKSFFKRKSVLVIGLLVLLFLGYLFLMPSRTVDFSADVKPILNKKCISCHGGVKKQGGFSFLFREEALAVTESGKPAIIPGDPDGSEMIRRITLNDPEERMPYKHDPLSKEEISILRRWIKQGAKWGEHWAYLPVQEQTVPTGKRRFFGLLKPEKPGCVKNEVELKGLKNLKHLYLYQTSIGTGDWTALKQSFPTTQLDSGRYIVPTFASDTTVVTAPKK